MKRRVKCILLAVLVLTMLQGCRWWDHDDYDCCDDHDGVAMCYRPIGASHGHIMCRDGHTCHEECE